MNVCFATSDSPPPLFGLSFTSSFLEGCGDLYFPFYHCLYLHPQECFSVGFTGGSKCKQSFGGRGWRCDTAAGLGCFVDEYS